MRHSGDLGQVIGKAHSAANEKNFFGQFSGSAATMGLKQAPGNALIASVGHRSLTEVQGDISYLLAPFNDLKAKISLIRSLDSMAAENGPHPPSFPTCAAL